MKPSENDVVWIKGITEAEYDWLCNLYEEAGFPTYEKDYEEDVQSGLWGCMEISGGELTAAKTYVWGELDKRQVTLDELRAG